LFDGQGYLLGIIAWIRKDAQNLNFAIAAEEYGSCPVEWCSWSEQRRDERAL
jgi:hypothetical protein